MKACRENCDRDARYNAAWARAQATVELERKALAEELERKAAAAAAEEEAREVAADAIFAEEERAALAPAPAPAKPSVAATLALFQAKATALIQQVEELEALKVAQEHVQALESRIAELKTELKIE